MNLCTSTSDIKTADGDESKDILVCDVEMLDGECEWIAVVRVIDFVFTSEINVLCVMMIVEGGGGGSILFSRDTRSHQSGEEIDDLLYSFLFFCGSVTLTFTFTFTFYILHVLKVFVFSNAYFFFFCFRLFFF